ncbi:MAG TPA: hypothetical protein PK513_03170 [Alphaproteobacteria bacterium]|nr:hypothetical protein [Alphaproteobacteria bacterium]USO05166.1 MAG: hypothetical protein H6859_08410 [Rhodospirillales bacterium]HOO81487.1 hypothetical protein [Alphaproteobacteria bacterium]
MFKKTQKNYNKLGAFMVAGMVAGGSSDAFAAGGGGGNDFSTIAKSITTSIQDFPGLLTALAYMFGILLGVLGVMKIKDHVENPTQTPLKDGAIRLAAGGALFALPMLFEAMFETLDESGAGVDAAKLNKINFNVT